MMDRFCRGGALRRWESEDMGINIYCEECGKEIEAEDITCKECYETLEKDLDALQQTVDEQGNRIKKLEDEIDKMY
jgi:hypothetical protein